MHFWFAENRQFSAKKKQNKNRNKCVSNTHIDKRGGAVKTMGNSPAHFSAVTFSSLTVCFYLAYTRLLKLTASSSNADVYEKLTILDEYLVHHCCCMVTRDHQLDDRVRVLARHGLGGGLKPPPQTSTPEHNSTPPRIMNVSPFIIKRLTLR